MSESWTYRGHGNMQRVVECGKLLIRSISLTYPTKNLSRSQPIQSEQTKCQMLAGRCNLYQFTAPHMRGFFISAQAMSVYNHSKS